MRSSFLAALCVLSAPAMSADPPFSLAGFAPDRREAYLAYERDLLAQASPDRLRETHMTLAQETHVAGTPADARTVDRIAGMFREAGLEVTIHDIWPLLASPVSASLEIVSPQRVTLDLIERPLKEDADSANPGFAWNAYSGSGEATGEIVYANYGTKADFARLKELGVDCTGRIVIARYGGNYRGYKAKFAQAAGAAGVLIYTDPADSGYMKGLTYPEGGFANDCCVQRGSLVTLPYQGDPLTPGVPATQDAKRLPEAEPALPGIPVQPIAYGPAQEIMSRMTGPGVPDGWQGGLPFAYRVTGGEALRVRMQVEQKREVTHTASVIATIPGSEFPDELVIMGAHHDAWNHGAADPLCGTITVIEAARSFAKLAREGHRPRRTLVFAAWAAEEFGIIGSSEWVEAHRENLFKHGVAYINLDMASMGLDFSASGSASLRAVIADAAAVVPQPGQEGKTVLDAWKARSADTPGTPSPAFGDIGGGSDHVAFLCYAGVPSAGFGSGGSKGSSYHSAYDTLRWYWKVVGADYQSALMVTRVVCATASRLANAPVAPLDPGAYGPQAVRRLTALGLVTEGMKEHGAAVEKAWASWWAGVDAHAASMNLEDLAAATKELMACDRGWLIEQGLPGRPWYKNTFDAPDEDSGYNAWPLPEVTRGVETHDEAARDAALAALAARLDSLVRAAAARQ